MVPPFSEDWTGLSIVVNQPSSVMSIQIFTAPSAFFGKYILHRLENQTAKSALQPQHLCCHLPSRHRILKLGFPYKMMHWDSYPGNKGKQVNFTKQESWSTLSNLFLICLSLANQEIVGTLQTLTRVINSS